MNRRVNRYCICLITYAWLCGSSLIGCTNQPHGPYTTPSADGRNPLKAQELTMKAAELIDKDPKKAEELLREALTADAWYGPGHNDLGVLELKKGAYYEAANEFEWARKLMPGHPDPRMNLALTLEKAGRVDEALATYGTALEVYPNHVPTMQALARLQIRTNHTDDRTAGFLKEIAMAGETPQWRQWAQQQMIETQSREKAATSHERSKEQATTQTQAH